VRSFVSLTSVCSSSAETCQQMHGVANCVRTAKHPQPEAPPARPGPTHPLPHVSQCARSNQRGRAWSVCSAIDACRSRLTTVSSSPRSMRLISWRLSRCTHPPTHHHTRQGNGQRRSCHTLAMRRDVQQESARANVPRPVCPKPSC
jgi:hypothetical protein